MFDLSGKCALVTGASGGIGGAISEALINQGAIVTLSGTRADALDMLRERLGKKTYVVPADIGSANSIETLALKAQEKMGAIDILINNAGRTHDNLGLRMKDEEWESILNINLTAAFRLSRACIKGMMKKRWGRIISISSVVGISGNAGQANYAASKAAMIGMSKSLALEVASRGITVNCVAPGFIETAMTDSLNSDQKDRLLEAIPIGRFGGAGDVAAAVLYLASDEASYVTGQTFHVNGGMLMI